METPLPATDAGAARAPGTGSAPPRLPRLLLGYLPLYLFLFLVGAEMYLVAPLLPTVAADIGVPVAGAAHLVTAYVLVQAVAGPPLGLANSRWGPRRMVGIGASLFIAGNATAALSGDYGVLIASRAAAGFGVAMAGPAIWAWIAASAPRPYGVRPWAPGWAPSRSARCSACPSAVSPPISPAGTARSCYWARRPWRHSR
ncbi:MFS transporter [Streptomyces noursei]|nr:MFS transporter [Streptomyces noursei]